MDKPENPYVFLNDGEKFTGLLGCTLALLTEAELEKWEDEDIPLAEVETTFDLTDALRVATDVALGRTQPDDATIKHLTMIRDAITASIKEPGEDYDEEDDE